MIKAKIEIKLNGKVVKRFRPKTFTAQMILVLHREFNLSTAVSEVRNDVTDVSRTFTTFASTAQLRLDFGTAGVTTDGVVIGTSSVAAQESDTKLLAQVTALWNYGATTASIPASSAGKRQFTIVRTFTNGTGGSVTINECGLYGRTSDSGSVARTMCLDRTIIPGGVAVGNGQVLTITYTISNA